MRWSPQVWQPVRLAETQLKMVECISSSGKTSGTVVWVQRNWPLERTCWMGGGAVGRPDRQTRTPEQGGRFGWVAPPTWALRKENFFPEGGVWEGKQSKQTEGIVHYLNDQETHGVCERSQSSQSLLVVGLYFKWVILKVIQKQLFSCYLRAVKKRWYTFIFAL